MSAILKLFLTVVALWVTAFSSVLAQENFLPGQVITKAGDTLSGFIDYHNWGRNPTEISFRSSKNDTANSYTPFDLQEFSVKDEHYVSAMVEREKSPKRTSALTNEVFLRMDVTNAFLQTLVRGSKSLYYLSDVQGIDQFYTKQDSSYHLLIYKRYLKKQKHRRIIGENRTFVRQLKNYLDDCPTVNDKLKNIEYSKYDLEKLFLHYYECISSEAAFQRPSERVTYEIGLLAGVSLTSLKFRGGRTPVITRPNYSRSTNFAGGLFLNFVIPRSRKKWIITNEIAYSSYQALGDYSRTIDINQTQNVSVEFSYSYIKMNNMLRYRYPSEPAVYANIGFSNGWAFQETNNVKVETINNGMLSVRERKALEFSRLYEYGFLGGLGVQHNKISLETRYERGSGMSLNSIIAARTNRWYLLLGYRF